MKAHLHDHGGCFEISLEAETLEDAATITRMATDSTKDLKCVSGYVYKVGGFALSVLIGARKIRTNCIQKAK